MAYSTVTSLASLFNTIHEDAIFRVQEGSVMAPLVRPYSATGWMDRKVPRYAAPPTAQAVDEDQDFANATEFSKANLKTLSPSEVMAQAILTDRRIATDPDGARADAAAWLGQSITNKIEADLLGLFTSFTEGTGSAGSDLTIDNIAGALAILRTTSKGNGGPIYVVLHPYQWWDIWNELGTPAGTYPFQGDVANQALRDHFVGNWLGASWFQCSSITIDSGDDAIGAAFCRDAIALDTRKAPTLEPERDASARAWELNMSCGYAYGIVRDVMGVKLTGDATKPT